MLLSGLENKDARVQMATRVTPLRTPCDPLATPYCDPLATPYAARSAYTLVAPLSLLSSYTLEGGSACERERVREREREREREGKRGAGSLDRKELAVGVFRLGIWFQVSEPTTPA